MVSKFLSSSSCCFGVRSGFVRGSFGVRLGSVRDPFRVRSGSVRGSFGVRSGFVRGSFGVCSGSLRFYKIIKWFSIGGVLDRWSLSCGRSMDKVAGSNEKSQK